MTEVRKSPGNKNRYRSLIEQAASEAYRKQSSRYTASDRQVLAHALAELNAMNRSRFSLGVSPFNQPKGGRPASVAHNYQPVYTPVRSMHNATPTARRCVQWSNNASHRASHSGSHNASHHYPVVRQHANHRLPSNIHYNHGYPMAPLRRNAAAFGPPIPGRANAAWTWGNRPVWGTRQTASRNVSRTASRTASRTTPSRKTPVKNQKRRSFFGRIFG